MRSTRIAGALGLAAAVCALVPGCSGAPGAVNDPASAAKASEIVYQGLSSSLGGAGAARIAPRTLEWTEDGFVYTQDGGGTATFSMRGALTESEYAAAEGSASYSVAFDGFVVTYDDGTTESDYQLDGSVQAEYLFTLEDFDLVAGTFSYALTMVVWSDGVQVTGDDIDDSVAMDVLYTTTMGWDGTTYAASGSIQGDVNGVDVANDSWSFSFSI